MSDANLMFNLLGKDVSASKALDGIHSKGKAVAGGIAGAFGGMAIGSLFAKSLEEGKIDSTLEASLSGTPEVAKKASDVAGAMFRAGWGDSLTDTSNAVKAVGQHMVDLGNTSPADLQKITTGAMAVAKVMGTDVVSVTDAAGKMMKNGLAPNAQAAMDIIATGAKNGDNAAGDLLTSLGNYGATFKRMGIDGPTALAMVNSSLKAGAPSAGVAMKGFQAFAVSVTSGSKNSQKAIASLGLDSKQMSLDLAKGGPSAKAATSKIIEAFASMKDPVAQAAAGTALFGAGWKKAGMATVLALDPAKQKIVDTKDAAKDMGDTLQDNAATKVTSMQRSFEHLMVSATNLPGPLGLIGTGIAALGPQGMAMAGSLATAAGAMQSMGVFSKIGSAATAVWTAAQWLFVAAEDAGLLPFIAIGLAIAAVIAVFVLLWVKCDWFRNFWIGLWNIIKGAVMAVVSWFGGAWNAVISALTTAWNAFKGFFSALWDAIKAPIMAVASFFASAFQVAFNVVKVAVTIFYNVVKFVFNAIMLAVKVVVMIIELLFLAVFGILKLIVNAFLAVWKVVWGAIVAFFTPIINKIKSIFSSLWDHIKAIILAIYNWVAAKFTAIRDFISPIIEKIKSFFSGLWDKVKAIFLAIYNWIADKIALAHDKIAAVIEKVKSVFSGLWDKVKAVFLAIYNWIADKIAAAHDKVAAVIDKVKNVFSSVWDKAKEVFLNIYNWIADKIAAAHDKVAAVIDKIKSVFSSLWDGVKSGFSAAIDFVKNLFSGVIDSIRGPVNAIIGMINMLIGAIDGIQIDIPSWVPIVGGKTFGVNIPKIPNMANGGIVMPTPGGTLARIGEAGHAEAVIPLNRMGGMGTTVNITVTGTLVGTKDALAVAVRDAVKGAQRRGVLPAGAFQ